MNNDTNTLGIRRNEMDATLVHLFSHTKDYVAKNVNNKVLAFVNQIESELNTTKKELAAFKKNNEELIQRCNAAISSWDEERQRALREADRVIEYKEKYEDLVKDIRLIGKQIFCSTGGTFENHPPDAIIDAAFRSLNESWKKREEEMKLSHDKTLESLRYNIERTKVFEALAEMLYKAEYDNTDAIKKIYEIVREKYPIGTYWMPSKSV